MFSKPYLMWLFPVLFFAYQFILRLWPGLMMHQIMEQFSIDATQFGMLAAFYYYGYAGMQIPVAILLDRYGARLIVFLFALICGMATISFIYTDHYAVALVSRFLIGAGSAVGFLGTSKVISEWFPKADYARMISLSFTVGLLGAVYGGKPVNMLIESYGWQSVALGLAIVSISLAGAALMALRSPSQEGSSTVSLSGFRELLSSPIIWALALANLLMVGALEGFADVWGVQYLMTAFDIQKGEAAGLVSFIYFGMLFGGPLLAYLSRSLGHYPVLCMAGMGMAFAFALLFLNTNYNWYLFASLFFSIGLLCCYQVIVFAAGADLVSPKSLGVTIAFLNCVNMFGGSFFHTLIGKIMDLYWTGALDSNNVRVYDLETYQSALSIVPMCSVLGALVILGLMVKQSRKAYAS